MLTHYSLTRLAGVLWLLGGVILITRAWPMAFEALDEGTSGGLLAFALLLGTLMGGAKGKFVLAKSARRNIKRIQALPEPAAAWKAWPFYLYLVIPVMIAMGLGVKHLAKADQLPGGWATACAVYVGIGMALFASGTVYFKKKLDPH
jgi:hypothetical protein